MGIPAAIGTNAAGIPPAGDNATAVLSGTITGVGPGAPFEFRGPMNLLLWASITTALTTTANSLAATVASATGLAAGNAINSVNVPRGSTIGALGGANVTLALAARTHYGAFLANGQVSGMFPTDRLVGATFTIPSPPRQGVTLPANTTVTAILQAYVAPTAANPGTPGIIQLSANPTLVPLVPSPNRTAFQCAVTGQGVRATGADAGASFTGGAITFNGTVQLERSFDGGLTWIVANIGASGVLAQWTGAAVGPISLTFGDPEKNVQYRLNCTAFTSVAGG